MIVDVVSPMPGIVHPLADVPDPVFAALMMGPGVAVEPEPVQQQVAGAPCSGRVVSLFPHAFALETPGGRVVLVHLGIDTVGLAGRGFTAHVEVGHRVQAGEPLLTWSPVDVAAAGLSTMCPVIALQADVALVHALVAAGVVVRAGDPVLAWAD